VVHQLFTSALDDIDDFCQSNSWLSDVWRYCSTWNQSQLSQLKGAPVLDIKVQPVIFHYVFSVLIWVNAVGSFAVFYEQIKN